MKFDLNYSTYSNIIETFKNYSKDFFTNQGVYSERHHIIPKCEGGTDSDGLVYLPYHIHAFAHFLRAKELSQQKRYKESYANLNAARFIITKKDIQITDDIEYIKKEILKTYNTFKTYVTNGEKSFRVPTQSLESFLTENPSFRKGRKFNSPQDKVWLNNGEKNIYVHKDEVELFLQNNLDFKYGMVKQGHHKVPKGFKGATKGKKWVHKGTVRKNVFPNEIDIYLNEGWELGSGNHKTSKGRKTLTKNGIRKNVPLEMLDYYLQDGWVFGTPKKESLKRTVKSTDRKSELLWVHKEVEEKQIFPEDLKYYLMDGWVEGVIKPHKRKNP